MHHIIASYFDYDPHRYGIPWAAPVDNTGRPYFSDQVGVFTGGRGSGGTLYVDDPEEGSVWAYGQKDYRAELGEKQYRYAVFVGGKFQEENYDGVLMALLNDAPKRESKEKRKETLLRVLFQEIVEAENNRTVLSLDCIMKRHRISREEVIQYGKLQYILNKNEEELNYE